MNDFQRENLIKAIQAYIKKQYCAVYYTDLYSVFAPEISHIEMDVTIDVMKRRGILVFDDGLYRLVLE
jgi:hypothetical protein